MDHKDRDIKKVTQVDLIFLKQKGLTNKKISKMMGISIKEIDRHLELQLNSRLASGVF